MQRPTEGTRSASRDVSVKDGDISSSKVDADDGAPPAKRFLRNIYRSFGPVSQLLSAVVVGIGLGLLFVHFGIGQSDWSQLLGLPGKLWLKALKCVVLPMIVFSMVGAMATLRALPCARQLGGIVIGLYLTTTVVAALEGCFVSAVVIGPSVQALPKADISPRSSSMPLVQQRSFFDTVTGLVDNLVPKNLVDDAAEANLLPVIVASIVFGLLIPSNKPDGSKSLTLQLLDELDQVVVKVVSALMCLTPLGVGSLVFGSATRLDLAQVGEDVGFLILAVATGLALHAFVFYPLLFSLVARRNPVAYLIKCIPAMATALGTASSAATLPVTVSCVVERNGVSPDIANFVLSLGATINMDGTSIYLICATYFLAALHGIVFDAGRFAVLTLMATLCSMGSAPVPSASLVLLATILTAVSVPLDETFALITAVDWMLDRLRTAVNVAGDATIVGIADALQPQQASCDAGTGDGKSGDGQENGAAV